MFFENLFLVVCPGCWLKMLLLLLAAFLLGLWLGWILWGKFKGMVQGLEDEIKSLKARLTDKETEFASLKYSHDELDKDNSAMRLSISGCEGDKAALQAALDRCKASVLAAGAAGTAMGGAMSANTNIATPPVTDTDDDGGTVMGSAAGYGTVFFSDNLQIVEGIGPKISRTLHEAGVNNWGTLAGKSNEELIAILDNAKINTKINDPKTWPKQAQLANEGKWDDLIEYQKVLDTGMENKGDKETPAKVEKLYLKAIGFAGAKPDNLKIIEGIGPKIEGLLKDAGVNTWSDLAACSVEKIKEVLTAAGDRYKLANPTTWPKQAELAAQQKWQELKKYQDYLDGGVEPGK